MNTLWSALRMFLWLTILTGVAYPLLITILAQVAVHHKANGSFVLHQDKVVGSSLIAQKFESNTYFWPRPSAIDYNALASGGSNLGPTSAVLQKAVAERQAAISKNNAGAIPSELVYASGSGLDPDISPDAAYFQVDRVAKARGLDPQTVKNLVDSHTQKRRLGLFGAPCVNVLLLNLALDEQTPKK